MFLFVSKRTRHAAAAGVNLFDRIRERERLLQIAGTDQGFFMAVSVNESFRLLPLEFQLPAGGLFFFQYEFFEQERCLRDRSRMGVFDEIGIFVPKRQDTAWFTSDDRKTVLNK